MIVRTPEEIEFFDKVVERIAVLTQHVLRLCNDWISLKYERTYSNQTLAELGHMTQADYLTAFTQTMAERSQF